MDTGCGYDLVAWIIAKLFPNSIVKSICPVSLHAATATVDANQMLKVYIDQLGEEANMLVLPDTPTVLSIGRRCMEHGYGFWWEPYGMPVLILPDGRYIILDVDGYIPYLTS